jgi:hypothetical protein
MIRRAFIAIALAAGVLSVSAPAEADQRPCVSKLEYRNIVNESMRYPATRERVHDHFDTVGTLHKSWWGSDRYNVQRNYRKCAEWGGGQVWVRYADWYRNADSNMRVRWMDNNASNPWQWIFW